MDDRYYEGYVITDSLQIGDTEFVLGKNYDAPKHYATWECIDGNEYYRGRYFLTRPDAERDFARRAENELESRLRLLKYIHKEKEFER